MSLETAELYSSIGKVIVRSHTIEKMVCTNYNFVGKGLNNLVDELGAVLPAILIRTLRDIAMVRNSAAHPDNFTLETVPNDFDQLCDEVERLIPYFVNQHDSQKPHQARSPVKATSSIKAPVNQSGSKVGKCWTVADDKTLTDGLASKTSYSKIAKQLQRNRSCLKSRIAQLGKNPESLSRSID